MYPSNKSCLGWQRLHVPYAISIFHDTPITTEEAHSADTGDTLAYPCILILVCLVDECMRLDIAIEVITDKVVIAMIGDSAD